MTHEALQGRPDHFFVDLRGEEGLYDPQDRRLSVVGMDVGLQGGFLEKDSWEVAVGVEVVEVQVRLDQAEEEENHHSIPQWIPHRSLEVVVQEGKKVKRQEVRFVSLQIFCFCRFDQLLLKSLRLSHR